LKILRLSHCEAGVWVEAISFPQAGDCFAGSPL
jgi:hypothetical protein